MLPVVEELAEIERLSTREIFSPFSVVAPPEVPAPIMNATQPDNVMPAAAVTA